MKPILLAIVFLILPPINLWQLRQLGDVIRVAVIVFSHRVPNVKRQNRGDQFSRLSITVPKRTQPLIMNSDLWSVRTGQLILNCLEHQPLSPLPVSLFGIHRA